MSHKNIDPRAGTRSYLNYHAPAKTQASDELEETKDKASKAFETIDPARKHKTKSKIKKQISLSQTYLYLADNLTKLKRNLISIKDNIQSFYGRRQVNTTKAYQLAQSVDKALSKESNLTDLEKREWQGFLSLLRDSRKEDFVICDEAVFNIPKSLAQITEDLEVKKDLFAIQNQLNRLFSEDRAKHQAFEKYQSFKESIKDEEVRAGMLDDSTTLEDLKEAVFISKEPFVDKTDPNNTMTAHDLMEHQYKDGGNNQAIKDLSRGLVSFTHESETIHDKESIPQEESVKALIEDVVRRTALDPENIEDSHRQNIQKAFCLLEQTFIAAVSTSLNKELFEQYTEYEELPVLNHHPGFLEYSIKVEGDIITFKQEFVCGLKRGFTEKQSGVARMQFKANYDFKKGKILDADHEAMWAYTSLNQ